MTQDIGKLVRDAEARLQEARREVAYKFGVPVDELRQNGDVSRVIERSNIGAGAPVAYNWVASRNRTLGERMASGAAARQFYEDDRLEAVTHLLHGFMHEAYDTLSGASVIYLDVATMEFLPVTVIRANIKTGDAMWGILTSVNHLNGSVTHNVDLWKPGTDSMPENWIASYDGDPTLSEELDPHVHFGYEQYWAPDKKHLSIPQALRVLMAYNSGGTPERGLEKVLETYPGFEFRLSSAPTSKAILQP